MRPGRSASGSPGARRRRAALRAAPPRLAEGVRGPGASSAGVAGRGSGVAAGIVLLRGDAPGGGGPLGGLRVARPSVRRPGCASPPEAGEASGRRRRVRCWLSPASV